MPTKFSRLLDCPCHGVVPWVAVCDHLLKPPTYVSPVLGTNEVSLLWHPLPIPFEACREVMFDYLCGNCVSAAQAGSELENLVTATCMFCVRELRDEPAAKGLE